MIEFAFDVNLRAVARVRAKNEREARAKLLEIDAVELAFTSDSGAVTLTEASLDPHVTRPAVFEVDGAPVSVERWLVLRKRTT